MLALLTYLRLGNVSVFVVADSGTHDPQGDVMNKYWIRFSDWMTDHQVMAIAVGILVILLTLYFVF